jgi:hypothetical protein
LNKVKRALVGVTGPAEVMDPRMIDGNALDTGGSQRESGGCKYLMCDERAHHHPDEALDPKRNSFAQKKL